MCVWAQTLLLVLLYVFKYIRKKEKVLFVLLKTRCDARAVNTLLSCFFWEMVWPLEMQIDDTVVCRIMMKPRADKLFCVFGLLNKMKISRYIIFFSDKDQFLLVS